MSGISFASTIKGLGELVSAGKNRWSRGPERSDFRKLWASQSVSQVGSAVSFIAFPLTAVLLLKAATWQVGVLTALENAPFLVFGLIAGVLVDRWRHRRILIIADWIRAVAMALVPIAWYFNVLTVEWLYGVAFVVGVCTVFFDIASQNVLTSIVERDDLMTANQRLEASHTMAQMTGPGVAAALMKVMSAPFAVAADALSFVISALFLHTIRSADPEPSPSEERTLIRSELKVGLQFIRRSSFLRWNAAIAGSWNLLIQALLAIFFIYVARNLGLGSTKISIVVFAGSLSAVLAVLVVGRVNKVLGLGMGIALATSLSAVGGVLLALVNGSSVGSVAVVVAGFMFISAAFPLFNINVISIRQAITPGHLMGRVTAAMRFLVWGTMPLGALLGGFLGQAFGNRPTIATIGGALLIPAVMTLLSPIRRIRDMSDVETADEDTSEAVLAEAHQQG